MNGGLRLAPSLLLVAAVTLFRVWAAAHLPLNNDEMYYWVWSRHPAYGYTDHPPMVAWLIGAAAFLGKSSLAIRSASILCLGLSAIAVRAAAIALGATALGAELAAIIFVLIPEPELFMAQALPNPPYLLFWALCLVFAARAASDAKPANFVCLGVAIAGAALSRAFGLVLLAGIVAWTLSPSGRPLRSRMWIVLLVFAALYAPFIWWNATHHWWSIQFTFSGRSRSAPTIAHLQSVHSFRALAYAALLLALTWLTARSGRKMLLAWTSVPLVVAFAILAFVQNVETYWLLGPVTSLCVAVGPRISNRRAWWIATTGIVATVAVLTMGAMVDAAVTGGGPLYDRDFVWNAVPSAVERNLVPGVIPVTDTYELAAPLAFYGIPVVMMGAGPQASQWQSWYGQQLPSSALVITLTPLSDDSGTGACLRESYREIRPGPVLNLKPSPTSFATFYTTWARGLRAGQAAPCRPFE
jgi:hypothetical protein